MDRSHELVEFLQSSHDATPAALASRFDVSERTVRGYVKDANGALGGIAAIEKRHGGSYRLAVKDKEALEAWLAPSPASRAQRLQTREARVAYLLDDLLHRTDWVTLDALSELLYVSKTSLSRDVKDVEAHLASYGLSIERRSRYGIRVVGPEASRRLCIAGLVIDGLSGDDSARASLSKVAACIDRAVARNGFHVNSAAYQNLVVHVTVALGRIKRGCYVPMTEERLAAIRDEGTFAVAQDVADEISSDFDVALPQEEVAYMALHLAGRQVIDQDSERGLVISDETWEVVDEMLAAIRDAFGFDFSDDLELRMNLARHVEPLSIRLTCHMHIENPLLAETRDRFPLAYSMAMEASGVLARCYGEFPSDHEVGYLALPLILAMERRRSEPAKKNILVVCASGQGSAKLLEYRYRQEIGRWIDRVTTCDAAHVDSVDFKSIDYVFTTVPLSRALPVPVREVRFFLDEGEVRDVRRILAGEAALQSEVLSFFPADLFFANLDAVDREDALDQLCGLVSSRRLLSGDLRALVAVREKLAQTSFGNRVAMPHPVRPVAEKTFVAVATLRQPVEWNGHEVQALFLACISDDHDEKREAFYQALTRMLRSPEAIGRLLESPTHQTLLDILKEIQTKENGDCA